MNDEPRVLDKDGPVGAYLDALIARRPVPRIEEARRKSEVTRRRILDHAAARFTRQGAQNFSLRAVAEDAGLSQGNLTYHYASKAMLMDAMIDDRIADYSERFRDGVLRPGLAPRARLDGIIRFLVEDLRSEEIGFFPQLWALGVADRAVWERTQRIYEAERAIFVMLLKEAAPDLPKDRAEAIALNLQAAINGLTLFIGLDRLNTGPFADPAAEILRGLDRALAGAGG